MVLEADLQMPSGVAKDFIGEQEVLLQEMGTWEIEDYTRNTLKFFYSLETKISFLRYKETKDTAEDILPTKVVCDFLP